MGEVYELDYATTLGEYNVVVEDEGGSSSVIVKEEDCEQRTEERKRCLVCKTDDTSGGDMLDIMIVNTSTSNTSAAYLIATMMMRRSSDDVTFNNTSMCKPCFNLLDRADELQNVLEKVKAELSDIKNKFRTNLNVGIESTRDGNDQKSKSKAVKRNADFDYTSHNLRPKKRKSYQELGGDIPSDVEELEVAPDDLSLWTFDEDKSTAEERDNKDVVLKHDLELDSGEVDKEEYKCNECGQQCKDKLSHKNHMKRVHVKHKCHFCDRTFTKKQLKKHMSAVHPNVEENAPNVMPDNVITQDLYTTFFNPYGEFKCSFCLDQRLFTKKDFVYHFHEFHNICSSIQCLLCNKHFTKGMDDYLLHVALIHGANITVGSATINVLPISNIINNTAQEGETATQTTIEQYVCVACPYSSTKREQFLKHKKCHRQIIFKTMQKNSYNCPVCNENFRLRRLQQHITHHTMTPYYKCQVCSEMFWNASHLVVHKNDVHAIPFTKKIHPCQHCTQMFATPKQVEMHVTTVHEGVKSFVCEICGKCLARRNALQNHKLRFHEQQKMVRCKLCGKIYKSLSIRGHLRKVHKYKGPRINHPFNGGLVPCEEV